MNFRKDSINYGLPFSEQIDPAECPAYCKVITKPIDLTTISNRLYNKYYNT